MGRLVWVAETFYRQSGQEFHQLGFYYLMDLPPGCGLCAGAGPHRIVDDGVPCLAQWHPVAALPGVRVFPSFLRSALARIPPLTEQVVSTETEPHGTSR